MDNKSKKNNEVRETLIVIGSIVLICGGIYVGVKHPEIFKKVISPIKKASTKSTLAVTAPKAEQAAKESAQILQKLTTNRIISYANTDPFLVQGHPRALRLNQHASEMARENALKFGCELLDGQTYVSPYMKCAK